MRHYLTRVENVLKPFDITLSLLLKLLSDVHIAFKQLSPLASISYVVLNYKSLLRSWKPLLSVLLFLPALLISPSAEIIRFIFSICLCWIIYDQLTTEQSYFSVIVSGILVLYVITMFLGIFNPAYYYEMHNHTMRYKFITDSHNALTVSALFCLIYLVNTFIRLQIKQQYNWMQWCIYIAILLLMIVFLVIKARLYIGLSFVFLVLIALSYARHSRLLAIAPIFYITFFAANTWYTQSPSTSDSQMKVILENKRVLNTYGTGRSTLFNAFRQTFQEAGWNNFIYQNNVDNYYQKKLAIPGINPAGSTLTESSYLVILLYTGILGLLPFLFVFLRFIVRFISERKWYCLIFFGTLMGTWAFEETVLFPLSLLTHLLALSTIYKSASIKHS